MPRSTPQILTVSIHMQAYVQRGSRPHAHRTRLGQQHPVLT